MRVLIVDDSKELTERVAEVLTPIRGLRLVDSAETVGEARTKICALQPHVIVLDLQLRNGSGIEILKPLKASYPTTKVIVFTNHQESQYRQRCLDSGADYFLCKSTHLSALVELLKDLAEGDYDAHLT